HREERKPSKPHVLPRRAVRFSAFLPTRRVRGRHSHHAWMVCEASWSFLKRNQRSRSRFVACEQHAGKTNLCRGEGTDGVSNQVPKGHLVDALAVRGDEGRDTLR